MFGLKTYLLYASFAKLFFLCVISNNSSGILACTICHRDAGLWNFHSLKDVTLINNDRVEQGDMREDEVSRDNDGQQGSHEDMEEDIPGISVGVE